MGNDHSQLACGIQRTTLAADPHLKLFSTDAQDTGSDQQDSKDYSVPVSNLLAGVQRLDKHVLCHSSTLILAIQTHFVKPEQQVLKSTEPSPQLISNIGYNAFYSYGLLVLTFLEGFSV